MKYFLFLIITVSTASFANGSKTDLEIAKIDAGVYLHTSYRNVEGYGLVDSNGLIVVDEGRAYIIDTPWSESDTEALLSWVSEHGYKVEASISTHFHDDRTAGIALLNSRSIPTYTSKLTNDYLVKTGKPGASKLFSEHEFTLRKGVIEIFYPGPGHTEDNLVVWLPKQRVLFGGCLVRSLEWDGMGNTADAFISRWSESVKNVKSKYSNIATVVPGHGKVGDAKILDHTIELADTALNAL